MKSNQEQFTDYFQKLSEAITEQREAQQKEQQANEPIIVMVEEGKCTCPDCVREEQEDFMEKMLDLLEHIQIHEENIETKTEWIVAFRSTIERLEDKIIEYKDKIAMSHRLIQKSKQEIKEVN